MLDRQDVKRMFSGLVLAGAIGCLAAACSEIRPEPDIAGGGEIQSPTHQQDALREDEERGEEGARR